MSRGNPEPLSRERILEAARQLLGAEGSEALSMRRLAQELDVWPMAVYRHFRDKDELVDALVDSVAQEVRLPSTRGPWRDQMRRLLAAGKSVLESLSPELRARLAEALPWPGGLPMTERGLDILESAGMGRPEAVRAWAALGSYTVGAAGADGDQFEYGLELMLDGLEATLAQPVEA